MNLIKHKAIIQRALPKATVLGREGWRATDRGGKESDTTE